AASDPALRRAAPGASALPLLRPLPARDQHPRGHRPRLRRRRRHRLLSPDLPANDRLPRRLHGAAGHGRHGDADRRDQFPPPRPPRLTRFHAKENGPRLTEATTSPRKNVNALCGKTPGIATQAGPGVEGTAPSKRAAEEETPGWSPAAKG